jgi:hypothetical protein
MASLSSGRTGGTVRNWLRGKSSGPRRERPLALELLEAREVPATWTALAHAAPSSGLGTMMLLSDGSVMAQGGGQTNTWYRLAPDNNGSYLNGTWTQLASMKYTRLYYPSNVLPDGRVFLVGGEYSNAGSLTNTGEIYDPVSNTWSSIANFPLSQFGDDPSAMLPDGRVLAGYISGPQTYIYNPATNAWSATGTKLHNDRSDEETWFKLPDDSVLSWDIFSLPHSQRYIPSQNQWVDAGNLPVNLSSSGVGYEAGPGTLLPDGRAFFVGATNQTALYNPATNSWAAGPAMPSGIGADDAPGAILPNGHFIFAADHPLFNAPTNLYDFDPVANTLTQMSVPGSLGLSSKPAYVNRMLVLPTGELLFCNSTNQLFIYSPDGGSDQTWKPAVSSVTKVQGNVFQVTGTQLNGISEGASYGDDAEMSSNYPIVRIVNDANKVFYARTHDWSSTGVATGNTPVTTLFTLPPGIRRGTFQLSVIANGIASDPVTFTINPSPGQSGGSVPVAVFGTAAAVTVTSPATPGVATSTTGISGLVLGIRPSSGAIQLGGADETYRAASVTAPDNGVAATGTVLSIQAAGAGSAAKAAPEALHMFVAEDPFGLAL